MRRLTISLLALAMVAACGDEANNDEKTGGDNNDSNGAATCSLQMELSGAVTESADYSDADGCSSSGSGGMTSMAFNSFGSPIITVGLTDATPGETGDGISGWVRYMNEDDAEWVANDCTFELTRNELIESGDFGDFYQLEGSGQCSAPAEPRGGGADGEIEIGDFQFAGEAPFG